MSGDDKMDSLPADSTDTTEQITAPQTEQTEVFKEPTSSLKGPANVSITTKTSEVKDKPSTGDKPVPVLPYEEPSWSGCPSQPYILEVIKNGVSVKEIDLSSKPYWVVGRLSHCDLAMEHPSLSRYHAVIQYCTLPSDQRTVGWYLYDLSSTHGTIVNKHPISPNTYHRLRVGYTFKFGGSTRLHILQGPTEDQEKEITPEDLAALREKRKAQMEERNRLKAEANQGTEATDAEGGGCSWGMDDDAEDVDPDAVNPFSAEAVTEELHLDDPKKTLRGWFEREGYDEPAYIVEEQSHGKHKCTVELPLDTPTGHPVKAEVQIQGKKKEAVVLCAMEACKILDKHGVLRQAKHASRKRKAKNWGDNDFYDSDDDTFLDRTGDIERKRKLRMKRAGHLNEEKEKKTVTYDELVEQLVKIENEMAEIEAKLERTRKLEKDRKADMDDLDAYMMSIKSGGMNATEKTKCKRRLIELKQEKLMTEKLINVAKPNSLQFLRKTLNEKKASATLQPSEFQGKVATAPLPATDRMTNSPTGDEKIKTATLSPVSPRDVSCQQSASVSKVNDGLANAAGDSKVSESVTKVTGVSEVSDKVTKVTGVSEVRDKVTKVTGVSEVSDKVTKVTGVSEVSDKVTEVTGDGELSDNVTKVKGVKKTTDDSERTETDTRRTSCPADKKESKRVDQPASLSTMVTQLKSKAEEEQFLSDPDHITWMPPKGQSGDGRTRLNEKYGY